MYLINSDYLPPYLDFPQDMEYSLHECYSENLNCYKLKMDIFNFKKL